MQLLNRLKTCPNRLMQGGPLILHTEQAAKQKRMKENAVHSFIRIFKNIWDRPVFISILKMIVAAGLRRSG